MAETAVKKRPIKRAAKKAAPKKRAVAKTESSKATISASPILPGDDDFQTIQTGRGRRKSHVANALDEMLATAVEKGHTIFQLRNGDPFTVTQVRYWAKKRNEALATGDEMMSALAKTAGGDVNHLQISGASEDGIVQISFIARNI